MRVGLGWARACGGLGRGCMAISCTLLAWRRVPSHEPRDRRSTWSKMEDEERSSSGVLPDGTKGQRVTVLKLNGTCPDLYLEQNRKWKHTHLVPPFNYEALRREQLCEKRITHHTHTAQPMMSQCLSPFLGVFLCCFPSLGVATGRVLSSADSLPLDWSLPSESPSDGLSLQTAHRTELFYFHHGRTLL